MNIVKFKRKSSILFCAILVIVCSFYCRSISIAEGVGDYIEDKVESKVLNSKKYWNERFASNDWQAKSGDKQTLYFYNLLVEFIPEDIIDAINSHGHSIADFGCAQGEGTKLLADSFFNASLTGIDFSESAIKIARQELSKASFIAIDLTQDPDIQPFDTIITSNTLEHFYKPWQTAEKIARYSKEYIIILVPFEEPLPLIDEHFYRFTNENIKESILDFKLIFKKEIDRESIYWSGKQVLLVYKK